MQMDDVSQEQIMIGKMEHLLSTPPVNRMVIVQVPMEKTVSANVALVRFLQQKGYSGVYVTLKKSYPEVMQDFSGESIQMEKLFFVDGISQLYGIAKAKEKNVGYVQGPSVLDDLQSKITAALEALRSQQSFIFIDSLTSLMLYNPLDRLVEFVRQLNELSVPRHTLVLALLLRDKNIKKTLEDSLEAVTLSID